jgi:hypothetical protein
MQTATAKADGPPDPPVILKASGTAELYAKVIVTGTGLAEWARKKENDASKLILFMNGKPMYGLPPEYDQVANNELIFTLKRCVNPSDPTNDNSQSWDAIFSRPTGLGTSGSVRITVGTDGHLFPSTASIPLRVIRPGWFVLYCVAFVFALYLTIKLARESELLRDGGDLPLTAPPAGAVAQALQAPPADPGPAPAPASSVVPRISFSPLPTRQFVTIGKGTPVQKVLRRPYSLARTQMAFWFFLVVGAYVFIWMVTGATDTITASMLELIGISTATGLAGVVIDSSKRAQAQSDLDTLRTEQATLQQQMITMGATFPAAGILRLNQLAGLIAEQGAALQPAVGETFLEDILSDANGISFHRLQIAIWTVVLGLIFCFAVYNALAMPNFSQTLLGLMGLSGGTYVGFKIPEIQS